MPDAPLLCLCRVHKKARHLGVFTDEAEAARVYDRQVLIAQGINNKGLNFNDSEWHSLMRQAGMGFASCWVDCCIVSPCRVLVRRRKTVKLGKPNNIPPATPQSDASTCTNHETPADCTAVISVVSLAYAASLQLYVLLRADFSPFTVGFPLQVL